MTLIHKIQTQFLSDYLLQIVSCAKCVCILYPDKIIDAVLTSFKTKHCLISFLDKLMVLLNHVIGILSLNNFNGSI